MLQKGGGLATGLSYFVTINVVRLKYIKRPKQKVVSIAWLNI